MPVHSGLCLLLLLLLRSLQFRWCIGSVLDALLALFISFGLGSHMGEIPCSHLSADEEVFNCGTEA